MYKQVSIMADYKTKPIKTLVFFDLETTGIPADQAKITEIALLAVSRGDIEEADGKSLPPMNKLSLLCNPEKDIQPAAAKITGLNNKILKNQLVFKDIVNNINSFLDMPKPVCLLAHNGSRYDFKIIQAEYKNANAKLPKELVCVDSLYAFRHILKEPKASTSDIGHNNSVVSLDESDRAQNEEEWLDLSVEETQQINELIDKFSKVTTTPKKKAIKKEGNTKAVKEDKSPKVNYKLTSLYERLTSKKVIESHRAEADCIMLLECVVAIKKDFLAYADSKQKLINETNS